MAIGRRDLKRCLGSGRKRYRAEYMTACNASGRNPVPDYRQCGDSPPVVLNYRKVLK